MTQATSVPAYSSEDAPRPRSPLLQGGTALLFVAIYVAGATYTLVTVNAALPWLPVMRLLVDFLATGLERAGVPAFLAATVRALIPVVIGLFALVVVLACMATWRTVSRFRKGVPELDVALRLRVLAYVAFACLWFNVAVLSTAESFSGPFRLRFPIFGSVTATFAFGYYALWSLRRERGPRRPRKFRKALDLIGANVVLTLVLAEILLRIAATFSSSPLLVTEDMPSQVRREANRAAAGSLLFNFPVNAGGHYDSEFVPRSKSDKKIVVNIGDSFSYGTVPHALHYTTVAEREAPGVDIYNMGYPNIAPSDYLQLLAFEAVPLQPDLVVVQLFIGNDVTDGLGNAAGPPRWHDADSYLVAVVWHRLRVMSRAEATRAEPTTRRADMTIAELQAEWPWLADPSLEKPSFSKEMHLEVETRNALGVSLADDDTYGRLFHLLSEMERAAALGNTRLAFALIPAEFQVEDDLWKEILAHSGKALDRDRPQRLILEWAKDRVPVLDLLPILRAVPPGEDGRRHLYHLQDTHFNARGNEVAGRALARFAQSVLSNSFVAPAPVQSASRVSPPPELKLPVRFVPGDSAARPWMIEGWSASEAAGGRTYSWSEGTRSLLALPLPAVDLRLDFEVLPFTYRGSPGQQISVIMGNETIANVRLTSQLQRYSVMIPARLLRQPVDTLEFRYGYTRSPRDVIAGSRDIRALSAAWYSIEFVTPTSAGQAF